MKARSRRWRVGVCVVAVALVALTACEPVIKTRRAYSGSVKQVWVTGMTAGTVELLTSSTSTNPIQTGTVDANGSFVFYGVAPATSYWVRRPGDPTPVQVTSTSAVAAETTHPTSANYQSWINDWTPIPPSGPDGAVSTLITPRLLSLNSTDRFQYGYLPMRDATRLAIAAAAPADACTTLATDDEPGCRRYPTVLMYTPYDLQVAEFLPPARSLIDTGYAVVIVGARGTGCSGGAYDGNGLASATDGYDAIELIGRQPFSTGSVTGFGFSAPAYLTLAAAALRPPHLSSLVLGGFTDTYQAVFPGGMSPFGVVADSDMSTLWSPPPSAETIPADHTASQSWNTFTLLNTSTFTYNSTLVEYYMNQRLAAAPTAPYAPVSFDSFRDTCLANQALHYQRSYARTGAGQSQVNAALILGHQNQLRSEARGTLPFSVDNVIAHAAAVNVPVMISGSWQDVVPGAAGMARRFTSAPALFGVYSNGSHDMPAIEAIQPDGAGGLARLPDLQRFLNLYTARMPATWNGTALGAPPATNWEQATPGAVTTEQTATIPSRVTILWDRAKVSSPTKARYVVTHHPALPGAATQPAGTVKATFSLRGDGTIGGPPSVGDADPLGSAPYTEAPTARPRIGPDPGSGLITPSGPAPLLPWTQRVAGNSVSFTTPPVGVAPAPAEGVWLLGPASADLWVKTAPGVTDANLQVSLSQVNPDGSEVLLQTGWRRASRSQLDPALSTDLSPVHTEESSALLTPGTWEKVRVEVPAFARSLPPLSRLRLVVSAPGGDHSKYVFNQDTTGSLVIGTSSTHSSSITVSLLSGVPLNDNSAASISALDAALATSRVGGAAQDTACPPANLPPIGTTLVTTGGPYDLEDSYGNPCRRNVDGL